MDVARLNMNYFEPGQEFKVINNIKKASALEKKDVAMMFELTGPYIRVLGFKNGC